MDTQLIEKKSSTKAMATAGFKAAEQIMDGWGCTTKDKQKIMRIAPSTYHKFKANPESVSLDSDQLERLSYIVNIHASLRIVFDNSENVKGFMALENHNPYFNGRSPLSIIRDGKFAHIYEVFCRIDSLRSGLWGVGVASVVQGFRLIPSKYSTINLFDDVANEDEFAALYELQALTNPRLANEVGDMSLLDQKEIPFHCKRGRSYAIAAFTHINRDGSRFANGQHGMLYIADDEKTATREVQFHQAKYWRNVTGLKYDRIIFRTLKFTFDDSSCIDIADKPMSDSIYDPDNYLTAQKFGLEIYMNRAETTGIKYNSVRSENGVCWALSTPYVVQDVIQCSHTEMVWNGSDIKHVDKIKPMKL